MISLNLEFSCQLFLIHHWGVKNTLGVVKTHQKFNALPLSKHMKNPKRKVVFAMQRLGGGFKYFLFSPYLGKIPTLTNIFHMGWFNHQPDDHFLWEIFATLFFPAENLNLFFGDGIPTKFKLFFQGELRQGELLTKMVVRSSSPRFCSDKPERNNLCKL